MAYMLCGMCQKLPMQIVSIKDSVRISYELQQFVPSVAYNGKKKRETDLESTFGEEQKFILPLIILAGKSLFIVYIEWSLYAFMLLYLACNSFLSLWLTDCYTASNCKRQ